MSRIRWLALLLAVCLALSLTGCRRPQQTESLSPLRVTPPAAGETTPAETPEAPAESPAQQPAPVDPKGNQPSQADQGNGPSLEEDGSYDSAGDVALYLAIYGKLPDNYITKDEARALGWSGGSLERYAPGKCIGGDRFGNYEGLLPKANGRTWTECDIDTLGANGRGAKRIVYSNDGLIYYTDDHYESFQQLTPQG